MNILHIGEAGLGLGDRDYYLEENETNANILSAYEVYIKRIMELIGYDEQSQNRVWETVIRIERELAKHKKTREERRDPLKRYNMRSIEEIESAYPNIPWREFFEYSGLKNVTHANVGSLKFMEFINEYITTLSLEEMKDFMVFGAVASSTGVLGEAFYDADFELYDRVMSGTEEKRPLWKRAMAIPNSMFGEAVGELYVNKYFPKENKQYMLKLVENLHVALGEHIRELQWMSESTKEKALEKLSKFTVKIGYPDKWKDYSEIEIDPKRSYLENVLEAAVWFTEDNYSKMDQPVDKDEWFMTPQTVNAYYNPTTNEICFPAAILQPPYFDINADDALNYGAIGVVIGHEMTHGFDDQGRRFDAKGNLANWWNEDDETRFKALTDILEKQFNDVEVAPGVHANGKFTLGENIADQGGLRVARTAYYNSLNESEPKEIDGFSAMQRFYLAYSAVWASNIRPEEILVRTKMDPHSLSKNRVNVTLRNLEPFFEAFNIKPDDPMYRPEEERVVIW
jgi:putative endopeptidase